METFQTYFCILSALRASDYMNSSLFLHQFLQASFTVSVQTW